MSTPLPDGIRFEGLWPDVKIIWPNGNLRGATRPEFQLWLELVKARAALEAIEEICDKPSEVWDIAASALGKK